MATRKSRNSTRSASSRNSHELDPAQFQQAAQQGSQQQMVVAADAASALLRGAEIWSQVQLNAIQRSGQSWREAAERMRAATGPLEFVGVQNQLVMNSFVQWMQFAQELMQAGVSLQLGATTQGSDAATASPAAPPSMMQAPMMQAWQAVMNPMGLNGAASAAAQ